MKKAKIWEVLGIILICLGFLIIIDLLVAKFLPFNNSTVEVGLFMLFFFGGFVLFVYSGGRRQN